MKFKIRVSALVYGADREIPEYMDPASDDFGIIGKEVLYPLKQINGKIFEIDDMPIQALWNWIEVELYGETVSPYYGFRIIDFVREHNTIKKYFCFDGLRYSFIYKELPISHYLNQMNVLSEEIIDIQLLTSANAGTIFVSDGIKYYFHSNEQTRHNEPHVHVDVRHETSGTYSIIDYRKLSGDVKRKDENKIIETIKKRQEDLVKYWNQSTNGIRVDLNQVLGTIAY